MNLDVSRRDMSVTVKVFGGLRESFDGGLHAYQLPSQSTLSHLLVALQAEFPDLSAKLVSGIDAGYLNVLVNGRNVRFLEGNDTKLHDGDTVAFLPPVGGG